MRIRTPALLLGGLIVLGLAACSTTARSAFGPAVDDGAVAAKPISTPDLETAFVSTADEMPAAETAAPAPPPCAAPSPTRSYPRMGMRRNASCGLPCERGCCNWHIRAVGGPVFALGDETQDDPEAYFGADVGWTSGCCCLGVDAFYRVHFAKFLRNFTNPATGGTVVGEDGGYFHHLGVKATIERSFCGSPCWFWYGGLGVQYFWTENYIVEDDGIGGFAELGVGYRFNDCFRIRAGLEALGQETRVGRENAALDNEGRFVMFVAPVLQFELTF